MHSIDCLVVTCEHGGNDVPNAYAQYFADAKTALESHRGYDIGALSVARALARRFKAPIVVSTTSRLLVDLNRSLHHPDVFSEMTRPLTADQKRHVVQRFYEPHRARVMKQLKRALENRRRVLHLGVHTFTPTLHGRERTAEIALLYDPKRAREKEFCARWAVLLARAAPDLRIRKNYPYRGNADGLTTTLRTQLPANRYLGVELEVNQRVLTTSTESTKRLRSLITATLAKLLR